jgi:uncharacterized ferredoxin-like protein
MSETRVRVAMSVTQRGILIALAKKELKATQAGLDDTARPMSEADRDYLRRYAANLRAAIAAVLIRLSPTGARC